MGRAGRPPKLGRAESAKPTGGLSLLSFYSRVKSPGPPVDQEQPARPDSGPGSEGCGERPPLPFRPSTEPSNCAPSTCSLDGNGRRREREVQDPDDCHGPRGRTAQGTVGTDAEEEAEAATEAGNEGKDEFSIAAGQEGEASSRCVVRPKKQRVQKMPEWRAWWAQPELARAGTSGEGGWTTDAPAAAHQPWPVQNDGHAAAATGQRTPFSGDAPRDSLGGSPLCAHLQGDAATPLFDIPDRAPCSGGNSCCATEAQRKLSRDVAAGKDSDAVLNRHPLSSQGPAYACGREVPGPDLEGLSEAGAGAADPATTTPETAAAAGSGLPVFADEGMERDEGLETRPWHASRAGPSLSGRGLGEGGIAGAQGKGWKGERPEEKERKPWVDESHTLGGGGGGDAGERRWEEGEGGGGYAWERWDEGEDGEEWGAWEDKGGLPGDELDEEQAAADKDFETEDPIEGWVEEPIADDRNDWDPAPRVSCPALAPCNPAQGASSHQGWAEEPSADEYYEGLEPEYRGSDAAANEVPSGPWQRGGAESVAGQQTEHSLQGATSLWGEPEAPTRGAKHPAQGLQRDAGEAVTWGAEAGAQETRGGGSNRGKRRKGKGQEQQVPRARGSPASGAPSREPSSGGGASRSPVVQASIVKFFASSVVACQTMGKGGRAAVGAAVVERRVSIQTSAGRGALPRSLLPPPSAGRLDPRARAGSGEASKRLRLGADAEGDAALETVQGTEAPQGRSQGRSRSRWVSDGSRRCPMYKRITGTSIAVDAFSYGSVAGVESYCLSHFHSDHYGGLTRHWAHGPIFCSPVTAALTAMCLGVDAQWLRPVEWSTPVRLKGGVRLTLLPANHCPGAALLHFVLPCGTTVLHTGDFRASREMREYPQLARLHVDRLYLDTTYCNPRYVFPSQAHVIARVVAFCLQLRKDKEREREALLGKEGPTGGAKLAKAGPQGRGEGAGLGGGAGEGGERWWEASRKALSAPPLFAVGSYSIGKERFYLALAEALGVPIFVERRRLRVLRALDWPELAARLTTDPTATPLHVLPLGHIRPQRLHQYLLRLGPRFGEAVGFRPTGWTFSDRFAEGNVEGGLKHVQPQRHGRASVYGIPYSEHSSFEELREFVQFLRPREIVPTVNVGSNHKMQGIFADWLAS